jgi:hypothetical protein
MKILRLSSVVFAAAAFAAAIPVQAAVAMAALPLANGSPVFGNSLNGKDCVDCGAIRVGGDAARIYFRGERRVHTPEQLLAQVSYCSPEIGASYFPDEEEHVAAYLNKQNYRFK